MQDDIIISKQPVSKRLIPAFPCTPIPREEYYKAPLVCSLGQWLSSGFFADEVEAFRREPNFLEKLSLYRSLPVAYFACYGWLMAEDNMFHIISYTGLLDFDIKKDYNERLDFAKLKEWLRRLPFMVYVGDDTDEADLLCVVSIRWPNMYAKHFKALKRFFLKYGLIISGSDSPSHFRKVSHDPEAIIKEEVQDFFLLE